MKLLMIALLVTTGAVDKGAVRAKVKELAEVKTSQAAVEDLVKMGNDAVPELIGAASEDPDLTTRGWAIVALGRIGGPEAGKALDRLSNDAKAPPLVKVWAGGARIHMAQNLDEVLALQPLVNAQPALKRPFGLRIRALINAGGSSPAKLLKLAASNWQLQQDLAEAILAGGPKPLLETMAHDPDMNVRQLAAGYVGTIAQRQGKAANETIGLEVVKLYKFDPNAKQAPWAGGPLYVPNIGWEHQMAKELVGALISWHLWAELNNHKDEQSKIANNLNSLGLANVLGYQPQWQDIGVVGWLKVWRQVAGVDGLKKLLAEQHAEAKYQSVVEGK